MVINLEYKMRCSSLLPRDTDENYEKLTG